MKNLLNILNSSIRLSFFVVINILGAFVSFLASFHQITGWSKLNVFVGFFFGLIINFVLFFIYTLFQRRRGYIKRKYKKTMIAYFPIKKSFVDICSNNNLIPINSAWKETTFEFDEYGFLLSDGRYLMSYLCELPSNNKSRTVFYWFRLDDSFNFDETSFIFSYGKARIGEAFGVFYGKPEIKQYNDHPKGLRIFLYCDENIPGYTNESIQQKCDSDPQISQGQLTSKKWYYTAVTYSSDKLTFYFGDTNASSQTATIQYTLNTFPNKYLFIGSIIPEISTITLSDLRNLEDYFAPYKCDVEKVKDRKEKILAFPYPKWPFCGYVREFMIFDTKLNENDITKIASITAKFISE